MNEQATTSLRAVTAADAAWDGVLVTTVTGEVDQANSEELAAELAARLDERPAALVVDLDGVVFFGSQGVTTLLEAHHHAQRRGVGFAVVAGRRPVSRTLQVTDTARFLRARPTRQQAVLAARSNTTT